MDDAQDANGIRACKIDLVKILIVDDDRLTTCLMRDIITGIGFDVSTRSNAEDAIDYFKTDCCDILISDVEMHSMSGLELARWVGNFSAQTRIVLMSAREIDPAEVQPGWMICRKPISYAMIQSAVGI